MTNDDLAEAHRRIAEQLSSDERVLGALPEDAARTLLDWELARLDVAAAAAPNTAAFLEMADGIRNEARSAADAAATDGDDPAALVRRLSGEPAMTVDGTSVESVAAGTEGELKEVAPAVYVATAGDAAGTDESRVAQCDGIERLGAAIREALDDAIGRLRRIIGGGGVR